MSTTSYSKQYENLMRLTQLIWVRSHSGVGNRELEILRSRKGEQSQTLACTNTETIADNT